MDALLIPGQKIHIIGIGGFGMSAIARILLDTGYTVTGSDTGSSPLAQALKRDGAEIFPEHDAANVIGAEIVIASSAISDSNIEIKSAAALGVPVLRRREAIEMITSGHRTIAIAGTHGKTTTSALMTHVLIKAGIDPTYIVGGVLNNTFSNAGVGRGDVFVIEADEYGGMFHGLNPYIAVITNLEYDHPDEFPNMESLLKSFEEFVGNLRENGLLVACIDSPYVARFAQERLMQGLAASTYSLHQPAEWNASNIETLAEGMRFTIKHNNAPLGQVTLSMLGEHNVQNALAVIAATRHLGVPFATISDAFATFAGTGRRSEVIGNMGGVTIISDYAHHPTAIQVTLAAWRKHPQTKRLWAVWQPHMFARLHAMPDEFAACFGNADEILVTDVYSVREAKSEGITAQQVAQMIKEKSGKNARYSGTLELTAEVLAQEAKVGDTIVILSAGDAPRIGQLLLPKLAIRSNK